jgi:hypothetical protein
VSTGELNRIGGDATARQEPPMVKGKRPKLFYATQVAVAPPTFVFFAREAGSVHFSYRRYLENRLRDVFGFLGTPIRLVFRERVTSREPRPRGGAGRKGGRMGSRTAGPFTSGDSSRAAGPAKATVKGGDARPSGKGRPSGTGTARATRRG